MTGQFHVQLANCEQHILTQMFNKEYPSNLTQVYQSSVLKDGNVFKEDEFFSGSVVQGSLLLVFKLRADLLVFHIESVQDVTIMKKTINAYFTQATRILDKNNVQWKKPEAAIFIDNHPFYGYIKTFRERLNDVLRARWEHLVLVPLTSIVASWLAIHYHILETEDYIKDVKKAFITTIEAYIGLMLVIIIRVLFKANKKEFIFTI